MFEEEVVGLVGGLWGETSVTKRLVISWGCYVMYIQGDRVDKRTLRE